MDNKVRLVMILLWILSSPSSYAQGQYGHFTVLKSFEVEKTAEITGIQGFAYGKGFLWCVTNTGALVKLDTTDGNSAERHQMSIHNETNWFYGAVDFAQDTLWVVAATRVFPLDATGQQIGDPIPLPHFDTPSAGIFPD